MSCRLPPWLRRTSRLNRRCALKRRARACRIQPVGCSSWTARCSSLEDGLAANRTAAAFALHRGLLARPAAAGFCSACCDRRVLGEGFCKLFFFSRRPQWGAIRPGAEGVGRWGAARGARMLWKGSGLVVAGCRAPRAQALLLLPPPSPPPALAALLPPLPETEHKLDAIKHSPLPRAAQPARGTGDR